MPDQKRLTAKQEESCSAILFATALLPVIFLGNAYAIVALWRWFVVPLGPPAIGMAHAFGLTVLFDSLGLGGRSTPKEGQPLWLMALIAVARCAFVYGLGYLAHLVMS